MRDRTPQYPGRVRLTHVSGDLYDLQMADQPEEAGTPLNKATLLQDSTAAMFGLGADAVPDDIFQAMPHAFYKYAWRRRVNRVDVTMESVSTDTPAFRGSSSSTALTSDVGSALDARNRAILNPTSVSGRYNQLPQTLVAQAPCYFLSTESGGRIYYLSGDSTAGTSRGSTLYSGVSSGNYYVYVSGSTTAPRASVVTFTDVIGEWEIVSAYDRDAYPDSGIVDDYEYAYIGYGKDFENALVTNSISYGTYAGTDTYGENSPCTLTFPFQPRAIYIWKASNTTETGSTAHAWMILTPLGTIRYTNSSDTQGYRVIADFNGNTVSWYARSAASQGNIADVEYAYMAIM